MPATPRAGHFILSRHERQRFSAVIPAQKIWPVRGNFDAYESKTKQESRCPASLALALSPNY
jgi:hypothetical protein